ncbi:MAG: SRPBCC domain-containing protein [Isosphaeraceae bacterium]|nr:SRPBCC domain-containing protein [Isosphaeraceae bacterium]
MSERSTHALEFTRVFDAPRSDVFEAFVERDAILAWWAPKGWYTTHAEMDVRAGGRYRFGMRSDHDPALMYIHGEYLVIDRPHELKFTYVWEPGGAGERWREYALPGVVTIVTLRFRDVGKATELFIRHEGFPTEPGAEQHRYGWASNWDCLAEYLIHGTVKPHARS